MESGGQIAGQSSRKTSSVVSVVIEVAKAFVFLVLDECLESAQIHYCMLVFKSWRWCLLPVCLRQIMGTAEVHSG